MDYYNFGRNSADSVEFLYGPPPLARRNCGDSTNTHHQYRSPFKNVSIRGGPPCPRYQGPGILSSTSLAPQKVPTEREIPELSFRNNYQNSSYDSATAPKQHKHKVRPIIKVTVIPNNTPPPARKRRSQKRAKRVQSSVSNREIKNNKNVYLVVTGKNEENIYHLKGTGSADVSLNTGSFNRYVRHDEIVEHNINHLLNSLDMDKKKKSKKKKDGEETENSDDCGCDVNSRRSRVRIVGRIGLTEDDRYVMRCAATIDGKPVETSGYPEPRADYPTPSVPCYSLQSKTSPIKKSNNGCPNDTCPYKQSRYQKEVNVQVNLSEERSPAVRDDLLSYFNPLLLLPCSNRSVETQCNPNSFNTVCFSNIEQLRIVANNKDQLIQCACPQGNNASSMTPDAEHVMPTNSYHSPLVVISVYPKQDQQGDEGDSRLKSKGNKSQNGKRASKVSTGSPMISPTASRDRSPSKSHSPSPSRGRKTKGVTKGDSKTKTNTKSKQGKAKGNREGLESQVQTSKTKTDVKTKQGKAKGNKEGPEGQVTVTKTIRKRSVMEIKSKVGKKNVKVARKQKEAGVQANMPSDEPDSSSPLRGRGGAKPGQRGTSQLDANGKKHKNNNWVRVNDAVSNDIISIEWEHELNDVGPRIREADSLRSAVADAASLENFLLVHEQRKRSFSQTFIAHHPPHDGNLALGPEMPAISVQDSYEGLHRPEEEVNIDELETPSTVSSFSCSDSTNNTNILPPIKHYRGDRCELFNPVERDKEIRELLGVKKHIRPSVTASATKDDNKPKVPLNAGEEHSLHCLFHMKQSHRHKSPAVDMLYKRRSYGSISDHGEKDNYTQYTGIVKCYPSITSICKCQDYSTPCNKKNVRCECSKSVAKYEELNPPSAYECRTYSNDFTPAILPGTCDCPIEDDCQQDNECDEEDDENYVNVDECVDDFDFEECDNDEFDDEEGYNKQHEYNKSRDRESGNQSRTGRKSCCNGYQSKRETKTELEPCRRNDNLNKQHNQGNNNQDNKTQFPKFSGEANPLYQQLILNRNVNIYLQIDQFTKQKPIILSRKQYDRVKRVIENACSKNKASRIGKERPSFNNLLETRPKAQFQQDDEKAKFCKKLYDSVCKPERQQPTAAADICDVTIGDTRRTNKDRKKGPDNDRCWNFTNRRKECESTTIPYKMKPVRTTAAGDSYCSRRTATTSPPVPHDWKRICNMVSVACQDDFLHEVIKHQREREQLIKIKEYSKDSKRNEEGSRCKYKGCCCRICKPKEGQQCCEACEMRAKSKISEKGYKTCYNFTNKSPRDTHIAASTTEVRYASVTLTKTKRVTFSTTELEVNERKPSVASILRQNYQTDSLHTIFKGHRKLPTPNLGTSAYSLLTEISVDSPKSGSELEANGMKPRKPFLRRLMSYIVMRSKTSGVKVGRPIPKYESIESSVDSYHISTSLGEIEVSSSIYDTSASFYSDHSIRPINSKLKRSFLSSVKGFLSNRKN